MWDSTDKDQRGQGAISGLCDSVWSVQGQNMWMEVVHRRAGRYTRICMYSNRIGIGLLSYVRQLTKSRR